MQTLSSSATWSSTLTSMFSKAAKKLFSVASQLSRSSPND
jgi:hypothetical protein